MDADDRKLFHLYDQLMDVDEEKRAKWLQDQGIEPLVCEQLMSMVLAAESSIDKPFMADVPTEPLNFESPGQAIDLSADLGPYRIIRQIGEGGMGKVYLAERREGFQMQVAIKTLLGGFQEDRRRRFHRERQILATLNHAHIARLLDGGDSAEGLPYLVMEYVDGECLTEYCDDQGLSVAERIRLFIQICDAVQYAHQQLILHRDLKPSNIMIDQMGHPKLLDFGVASLLESETGREQTQTSAGLSPAYASPEQIRAQRLTAQSDVYALGAVLYELLTGELPFSGDSSLQVMQHILEQEPELPSKRIITSQSVTRPQDLQQSRLLKGDLDHIILKCLEKAVPRRYASVFALIQDLERYLAGETVSAQKPSFWYRSSKWVNRHRWVSTLTSLLLISTFAYLFMLLHKNREIAWQRDEARKERDAAQDIADFLSALFEQADPLKQQSEISADHILKQGVELIQYELIDQPAMRGRLLSVMGSAYRSLGETDEAWTLLQEAETLQAAHLGKDHWEYARTLERMSLTLKDQGQLEKAKQYLSQALSIHSESAESASNDYPSALNQMGVLQQKSGEYESAESYLRQAETLFRQGQNHKSLAATLNNIGHLHQETGHFEIALEELEEAHMLHRDLYGARHPTTAVCLNNIGLVLRELGRSQEAATTWAESYSIRKEVLGDSHPHTLSSLNNLASIQFELRQLTEAQASFREVVRIKRQVYGADHPSYAISMNNLALVLANSQGLQEAKRLLDGAWTITVNKLGENHLLRFSILRNQALVAVLSGEPNSGLKLIDQSIDGLNQLHQKGSLLLAHAQGIKGLCLHRLGRHDDAKHWFELSLAYLNKQAGPYQSQIQSWYEAFVKESNDGQKGGYN